MKLRKLLAVILALCFIVPAVGGGSVEAVAASPDLVNPMTGTVQGTGYDESAGHYGIDIHAPKGTPVYAVASGYIDYSEFGHTKSLSANDTTYSVKIRMDDPLVYGGKTYISAFYTHLSELVYEVHRDLPDTATSSPQLSIHVNAGDLIGYSGIGNNAAHLHFSFETGADADWYMMPNSQYYQVFGWDYSQSITAGVSSKGRENLAVSGGTRGNNTIESRIITLCTKLGISNPNIYSSTKQTGMYFTTDKAKATSNSDNRTYNYNVIAASWFVNLFGSVARSSFTDGWTCVGFAKFADWYIHSGVSGTSVPVTWNTVSSFSQQGLSSCILGDRLYLQKANGSEHQAIFLFATSSGVVVLDSNWFNTPSNIVAIHQIDYSSAYGNHVQYGRAYGIAPPSPGPHSHNYTETGTEYDHPHKEYKRCSCGAFNYTGNTSYRSSCGECNGSSGCTCSTSYAGQYIVSTNSAPLTIRSGHGTSYTAVGSIPKGTEVTVTKANGSWAHVTYNGISGCVSMEYLKLKIMVDTDTLYPVPFNTYPLSDAQHAADAYSSIGGTHVGYIYGGDFCTIKEVYSNGWCLVNCPWSGYSNGRDVYAYTGAFLVTVDAPVQMVAETRADTFIRASGSTKLGWIDSGDSIVVVGAYGDRTQVIYPNGVGTHSCAWVPSSALVHNHTPGAAANCTLPQVCTKCDAVITPALGHAPGVAATCTAAQTCTRCGIMINGALGHEYGLSSNYVETHPHNIYKTCIKCGDRHYTGEAALIESCTTCFPAPTNCTITSDKSIIFAGDGVAFTLNADGADRFSIIVGDGTNTIYSLIQSKSNTLMYLFTNPGTYYVWGYAYNGSACTPVSGVAYEVFDRDDDTPEFVRNTSYNGHSYSLYSGTLSWTGAQDFCEAQGGYLMTITSEDEQNLIDSLNTEGRRLWVGGYRSDDTWKWVTSEEFAYTNWNDEQPDNWLGIENYLEAYGEITNKWNDTPVNYSGITGFIMETVPTQVGGVNLNNSYAELQIGETLPLIATVTPSYATDKSVTWSSDNPSIATVSADGLVTAQAAGTAVITVTTNSGNKTAECTVTVVDNTVSDGLKISVGNKTAVLGSEITVPITLTNNPGLASIGFGFQYDSTVLEYVSFEADTIFPSSAIYINDTESGSLVVSINDAVNHNGDGVLLNFTFRVLSTAGPGSYDLIVDISSFDGIYGMYNETYEQIDCAVQNGNITVIQVIKGDVDGNGVVNRADLVKMTRYFARYPDAMDMDTVAADVDGVNGLTRADLVKMTRYFARYITTLD